MVSDDGCQPYPLIISASRRTDIPAFYMDWFMACIERGVFEVTNPFNKRRFLVPATPDKVHTIVFWSKDFGEFLRQRAGERLLAKGYHLFFNFTINSAIPILEPQVASLDARLDHLSQLCERFDPQCVQWRFDPICFFRQGAGEAQNNLKDFSAIAQMASHCGVRYCITSFMDHYRKIGLRLKSLPGMAFIDPPVTEKLALLREMQGMLNPLGIELQTCCEQEVQNHLSPSDAISVASCIPSHRLQTLFGGRLELRKDAGQRLSSGCGCRISRDIGSYQHHPCHHNCLFCYANPAKWAQ